ncbi:hypothetical protein QQX98_003215 [Neonectria punicea]|uniref:Nephrocystin 3-like N-terminal domain-containing protein n=1 Tax=Neonectria punicea TaxID=979145 RepID=A0ABR1HF35_9HYPO
MSGLEALGLACNIFQVISFGRETASLIKNVYRDGSVDDALEENAKDLADLSSHVQTLTTPNTRNKQERQLLDIAKKCQSVARDLTEEIAFVVGHKKKGSLTATIKVAAKANWRKRRLDNIERKLNDAERLMQSGLLARACAKADATHLDLKSLDKDLRIFLQQYHRGHRDTSDLVSAESFRTRNHVTAESERVRLELQLSVAQQSSRLEKTVRDSTQTISTTIATLSLDKDQEAKRDRFLRSLKFPGMNERRNQIKTSQAGTFQWIFEDDAASSEDDEDDDEEEWDSEDDEDADSEDDDEDDEDEEGDSDDSESQHESDDDIPWDSFMDWLKSNSPIFWCSGKPGSGKSTLVKYIISEPRTLKALDIWNPGVFLVSHFFWRPGSSMQQSIRGMFCSLLFQLLGNDEFALDSVISAIPRSEHKDSETDWSTEELRELCFSTMKQYRRPICLFLDGLDEVSPEDGVLQLLTTTAEFSTISNVKSCLSSRPEYLIDKRLGGGRYPSLRLQDLTVKDLRKYAKEYIQFPPKLKIEDQFGLPRHPLYVLVQKAQGVFLWLCLAIRSLNRGFEHGNDPEDLQRRFHSLPDNLAELYKDMWARLNEDQPLYRQSAALYFGLAIANQAWPLGRFRGSWFNFQLNVFDMMLVSTSMTDQLLGPQHHEVELDTLVTECKRIEADVLVRCAGILELSLPGFKINYEAIPWNSEKYGTTLPFVTNRRSFQFIHRSAYDFLVDTVEGREIMSYSLVSTVHLQRRILRAELATCRLALVEGDNRSNPHLSYYENFLPRRLASIRVMWNACDSMELEDRRTDWYPLIEVCEQLSDTGQLFAFSAHPRNIFGHSPGGRFLVEAACAGLTEWVLSAVEHRNVRSEILSEILFQMCCGLSTRPTNHDKILVRKLLQKGADVNWKTVAAHWESVSMVETPLSILVKGGFEHMKMASIRLWYLQTLADFVNAGANSEQSVCVYIDVCHQDDSLHFNNYEHLSNLSTSFLKQDPPNTAYKLQRTSVEISLSEETIEKDGWTIWAILPGSVLIRSTIAHLSAWQHPSLETDNVLRQLDAATGSRCDLNTYVLGLDKSAQRDPSSRYLKVSSYDSTYLTELIIPGILQGHYQPVDGKIPNTASLKAEGIGKRLDEVVARSELAEESMLDRLKHLGLAESKSRVYVDDNGVEYPREIAMKMAPPWMSRIFDD